MAASDIPGRAAFLWIYDEFLKVAPQRAKIVEVGVALGRSIAYVAEECIRLGRDDIIIYAIDPWAGTARNGEQQSMGPPEGDYELFERTMKEHAPGARDRIVVIRYPSVDGAKCFGRGEVNLVVIDAAHDYANVRADIDAWRPKLALDGWMGGDDYEPEYQGVIDAVTETWGRASDPFPVLETRRECDWGTWLVRGAHV